MLNQKSSDLVAAVCLSTCQSHQQLSETFCTAAANEIHMHTVSGYLKISICMHINMYIGYMAATIKVFSALLLSVKQSFFL